MHTTDNQPKGLQDGIEAFACNDYNTAFFTLLPIAEQGEAEAQCIIGSMYWLGLGAEKDFQAALRWLHKAAEQGHANACNTLECIYMAGGLGLLPNTLEAKKWYRKAVENGFDMYPPGTEW